MINFSKRKKFSLENKGLDISQKKVNRKKIYQMMHNLCNRMLKAAGATIIVKGAENLPTEGASVYMSTHKGLFDIPVLVSLVEEPLIFIGKKETSKLPIIGKWFDATGSIYIDREDMKQSLVAILEGIKELKEGNSVAIFPEGTRSKKSEMGTFKAGSFKLATKANVPIVPIAIQNTHHLLEESKRVKKATIYVNIGKPIQTKDLTEEEKKKLPAQVQNYIQELLCEITR
jgi:1-acyl-sn-glycerol-3-phosphate acyltransferase